jgi:CRP-like cAMP-binding protein
VEEGSVELVRRGEVKHEVTAAHYFGAIPMFSGKPAKATARVKEQCKIFRLPEEVVKRLDKEVVEIILAGAGNKYL